VTCIAGIVGRNNVWMGGDSAGVAGYSLSIRKDVKVFKINNRFLIGYTSSFRMGQLLRFNFDPPEQKKKTDDYEYLCTDFIEAVRERLKKGGYTKIKENQEVGGTFLVGYNGRLYEISNDFQVGERIDDFNSIGCGSAYALSSLYMTKDEKEPKKRILQALEAAGYFSAGVSRPFVVEKLTFDNNGKPEMARPVKKGK